MPDDDTCEYVLDPYDPATWNGAEGELCYVGDALNENGVWACPHDSAGSIEATTDDGDEQRCLFHLPPEMKDDEDVLAALLSAIEGGIDREKVSGEDEGRGSDGDGEGDGGDIPGEVKNKGEEEREGVGEDGDVGVDEDGGGHEDTDEKPPDGVPASVRSAREFIGARFGTFDFRGRTLEGIDPAPLNLKHARFEGAFDAEDAVIGPRIELDGATLAGGLYCRGTTFENGLTVRGSSIEHGLDVGGATVGGVVDFRQATVSGGLSVRAASVSAGVDCGGLTVADTTSFGDVKLAGGLDLTDARLGGEITFRAATVEDGVDCRGMVVEGESDFSGATLSGGVDLGGVNLSNADFRDATLHNATFRDANLTGADFRDADLQEANLERSTLNRAVCAGANLRGAAMFGAVVGDAVVDERTTFGEYCPYDPAFEPDPALAADRNGEPPWGRGDGGAGEDGGETDVEADRLTRAAGAYRLVEQLGRTNTLPDLVVHSVVRRRDVLRRHHYATDEYGRWLGAWLSRLVALYGESWKRPVATGSVVVLAFGILYPLGGWIAPPNGQSVTYEAFLAEPLAIADGLYFSLVTFVSLGYGDLHPVGFGRILAAVEALLGAVLLILLVFVFARRGTR